MKKLLLIWLTCLSWCACAIELSQTTSGTMLTSSLQYLEDPQGQLTFADISRPEMAARFRAPSKPSETLNLGLSQSVFWLRLSLRQAPGNTDDWLIDLPYALLNQITFYAPGMSPVVTGSDYPMASRAFFNRYFVFPIKPKTEDQDFYFRVSSQNAITVPLHAWSEREFMVRMLQTIAIQWVYFGSMLGLALYTLFMFVLSRDRRYGLYAAYVVLMALSMTSGSGVARMFLWPDVWRFDSIARNLFISSAVSIMLYLSGLFLKIEYRKPHVTWGWKLGSVYFGVYAAVLLLSLLLPLPSMVLNTAMLLGGLLSGVLILGVVFKVIHEQRKSLQFFCFSWLIFWIGIFIGMGRTIGLLPTNPLTSHAVQIASMAEMVLLFLALADQFRQEQVQRFKAQESAITAQKLLLENLQSSNDLLETAVNERTEQLRQLLTQEQAMLTQYKRFGAMVSHEFRNPLSIIKSQLSLLRKEQELGELQLDKRLSVLRNATERLTIMFEKWLQSDRLSNTLQDIDSHPIPLQAWLKHFVTTNVHCLMGSPVRLAETASNLHLFCDEYLLDIALGNLVDNARKYGGANMPITIETRQRPGQVGLAIIDQGPGIAPDEQKKVFDDYFRIAPQAGISGVGLGLSIISRIIQAHGGEIELNSQLGQGSVFILWFPEKQVPVH